MSNYKGVIIEESLEDKSVLKEVDIISTEVEKTTPNHQSSVDQWTLHTVTVPENRAEIVADKISKALKSNETWYADFKNNTHHYIIFKDRVFFIDRTSKMQYDQAKKYGLSLGIPEHQVDFKPE